MRAINMHSIENILTKWGYPVIFILGFNIVFEILNTNIPDWATVTLVISYIIFIHRFYKRFFKENSERSFGSLVQNPGDVFDLSSTTIKLNYLEKQLLSISEKDNFINEFHRKIKDKPRFGNVFNLFNSHKKRLFGDINIGRLGKVHNISTFYFTPTIIRQATASYEYFVDTMTLNERDKLKMFDILAMMALLDIVFTLGKNLIPFTITIVAHDIIKFIIVLARENFGFIKIYLKVYDKMIFDFEHRKLLDSIDKKAFYQLDIPDDIQKKLL